MKNLGIQNERDFVTYFNNKYLNELDKNSQKFILDIFEEYDVKEPIIAWKNKAVQKADIYIKNGKYTKGISIKLGDGHTVHAESLEDFKDFLIDLEIPYKIIDYYLGYHYGYQKENNKIIKRLSAYDYISLHQNEIKEFNKQMKSSKKIIECVDRFIIRGRNSRYDISAIVHGTPDNFIWLKKDDIYDLFLSGKNALLPTPHISHLTIGPKVRKIDVEKVVRERYIVTIKWHNLKADIELFLKEKKST